MKILMKDVFCAAMFSPVEIALLMLIMVLPFMSIWQILAGLGYFYAVIYCTDYNRKRAQALGEVTVTKNEKGDIIAVTRTDSEHKVLEVIAKPGLDEQTKDENAKLNQMHESEK